MAERLNLINEALRISKSCRPDALIDRIKRMLTKDHPPLALI